MIWLNTWKTPRCLRSTLKCMKIRKQRNRKSSKRQLTGTNEWRKAERTWLSIWGRKLSPKRWLTSWFFLPLDSPWYLVFPYTFTRSSRCTKNTKSNKEKLMWSFNSKRTVDWNKKRKNLRLFTEEKLGCLQNKKASDSLIKRCNRRLKRQNKIMNESCCDRSDKRGRSGLREEKLGENDNNNN